MHEQREQKESRAVFGRCSVALERLCNAKGRHQRPPNCSISNSFFGCLPKRKISFFGIQIHPSKKEIVKIVGSMCLKSSRNSHANVPSRVFFLHCMQVSSWGGSLCPWPFFVGLLLSKRNFPNH